MIARPSTIRHSSFAIRHSARPTRAFTLVEIVVAVGVLAILGVALVGLMMAGVGAWRDGEAARQVQEKVQALQRQIADDFAAAVLDPPPVPDFHYVLDTLWDLPTDKSDPYYPIDSGDGFLKSNTASGQCLRYFAPAAGGSAEVILRVRVPFIVQAALLSARLDVLDTQGDVAVDQGGVKLEVGRNDPTSTDPNALPVWGADPVDQVNQPAALTNHRGWIGGGEFDVSAGAQGGDIVFIKATLHNAVAETAQFLRGDKYRSEGRPVLILDCYKDANALPQRPRPVFKAYFENGSQVLMITRTIPGETEKAVLRNAGSGNGYLNYADPVTSLLPLGGRATVVYRYEPYPPEMGKPGLGVLKRSFEAPIGRPIDDWTNPIYQAIAFELIPNVAHFGVSFWGGDTTTWEPNPELETDYDKKYSDDPKSALPRLPHPASQRWLSSRYMPEQVQVTLVLEPDGGRRVTTALAKALTPNFPTDDAEADRMLLVDNTRGFYNVERSSDTTQTFLRDPRHYIKIGDEWVFYERVASPAAFLIPKTGRGQRGTAPTGHPVGTEVLRGTPSVFTVTVPAFRHWQR